MNLYPLTFVPLLKEKLWGGEKIKNELQQTSSTYGIGECWSLCCRKDNESVIANGAFAGMPLSRLLFAYPNRLLGSTVYKHYGAQFPLLFKFIDAAQNLSIQVHPSYSAKLSTRKNEFWYVLQRDKHPALLVGLKKDVGQPQLLDALAKNNLAHIAQEVKANVGDFIHIPAGQIHAITAGFFVAEISENSDTTYRLYDWNRKDIQTSKPRQLHIEEALQAITYKHLPANQLVIKANKKLNAQQGPQVNEFATERLTLTNSKLMCSNQNGFSVFLCISGCMEISTHSDTLLAKPGQAVLIPAALGDFTIDGHATLLHTYYNKKE